MATVLLGLSAQGCTEDGTASPDGGAEAGSGGVGGTDAAIEGPEVEIGQFTIKLVAPHEATPLSEAEVGSTSVIGAVGDKPKAEALIWEVQSEGGGCKLLTPRAPFCEASCGREICVEDDVCEADRNLIDVGLAMISGVVTSEGESGLTLISVRNTYQNGIVDMPYPAFEAGDTVTLSAAGTNTVAPFTIVVTGTDVLDVPAVDYPLVADSPLDLTWTAPSSASTSRILVKLDISHHGGSKGKIECDVLDNGALTIPAEMITDLLALGVAGFPSIVITRYAEQSTQLSHGRVVFQISEYAERWILIDGLMSCTATAQCPEGQTCRDDKTCG